MSPHHIGRSLAVVLIATLTSCSTLIPHKPKVRIEDPSGADELKAYDNMGGSTPVEDGTFKANNRNAFFTVERRKKGFITDYHTIHQSTINPLLAIDGGILLGGLALTLLSDGGSGVGLLSYGALGTIAGHKKTFKRRMELGSMRAMPAHQPEQMHLYVDKVSLKLGSGQVDTRNFRTIKKYRNKLTEAGQMNERRRVVNRFSVESMDRINASMDLNRSLHEVNYIDTTNALFRMQKANMVEVEVTEWDYNYIRYNAYSFQLTSKWSMKDNLSKETLLEGEITSVSDVMVGGSANDLYRKGFVNALTKAMVQFMETPGFADAMRDKRLKFQPIREGWSDLTMSGGTYESRKIGECSRSVATVRTKDGHGSGVFIGADGYLITNLHVVGSQTADLGIILSDGTELKGEVVRHNPIHDLALVKVAGYTGEAIRISDSKEIELGETVFAVGTPNDVSLGQTVTRGIISSKRVFNDNDFIQTDVSVNPGNSGGALFNNEGLLVGVVNAKVQGVGVEGIGFAIPAYYIQDALKITVQ